MPYHRKITEGDVLKVARRLPVYLLLDCSGSMSGEPIENVRQGVETLHSTLLSNPMAMDTAYLSVITFSNTAKVEVPLTSLVSFQPPQISADGLTAMGQALHLLLESVDRDVERKKSETARGDYRPLVFLLTDGRPTDKDIFSEAVKQVRERRWGQFVACAIGKANVDRLLEITDSVLMMEDATH